MDVSLQEVPILIEKKLPPEAHGCDPEQAMNINTEEFSNGSFTELNWKVKPRSKKQEDISAKARMRYRKMIEERGYAYTPEQQEYINMRSRVRYHNLCEQNKRPILTPEQARKKMERDRERSKAYSLNRTPEERERINHARRVANVSEHRREELRLQSKQNYSRNKEKTNAKRRVANLTKEQKAHIYAQQKEGFKRRAEKGGLLFEMQQEIRRERRRAAHLKPEQRERLQELLKTRDELFGKKVAGPNSNSSKNSDTKEALTESSDLSEDK